MSMLETHQGVSSTRSPGTCAPNIIQVESKRCDGLWFVGLWVDQVTLSRLSNLHSPSTAASAQCICIRAHSAPHAVCVTMQRTCALISPVGPAMKEPP